MITDFNVSGNKLMRYYGRKRYVTAVRKSKKVSFV